MSKLIVDLGRVLYLGPWEETAPHNSMVPIIGGGIDADIHIRIDQAVVRDRIVYVPAGIERQVDARGGRLAVFLLDPQQLSIDINHADVLDAFIGLADSEEFTGWNALLRAVNIPARSVSAQVAEAAAMIMTSSDENVPGAELAARVGYSLSHLQELFRTQLGLSMRSYRTWQRFVDTATNMATADTITDAAVRAGFYDAAHFTNSFVATFGVTPSAVFSDDLDIHVVGGPWL